MKRVTITFDDGPDRVGTPHVLSVLERHSILSSFFVIGEKMADPALRALARQVRDKGHWIGNHTTSHTIPLGQDVGPDVVGREIDAAQRAIGDLAGTELLFRPFGDGGNLDGRLLRDDCTPYLVDHRITCVLWNVVPHDWEDEQGWVERALAECDATSWPVVVLHDTFPGAMQNLERFVLELKARGYSFEQEFPEDCMPIRAGKMHGDLRSIVTPWAKPVSQAGA